MASAVTTRKVIMAVDPSDQARFAFDFYMKNVWRKDDLVIITHCAEQPQLSMLSLKDGLNIPVDEWKKKIKGQLDKVQNIEEDYAGDLIASKAQYKMRIEQYKNPGEGIVNIAEQEKADLIVVGTRGLGAVKKSSAGQC